MSKHGTIAQRELNSISDLIKRLPGNHLAFALWTEPHQSEQHMIIDLGESKNSSVTLEEFPPSFVFNTFAKNHPIAPRVIHADIQLKKSTAGKLEAKVNPAISASKVERLNSLEKKPLKDSVIENSSDFEQSVSLAVDQIANQHLSKVVLSRFSDIAVDELDIYSVFEKMLALYPAALKYVCYDPEFGLWMGATPERLIASDHVNQTFETEALAGTQKIDGRDLKELAWTIKEIEEQAMVSRYIVDCFKKIRLREFEEKGPRTVKAGNLAHLKTTFTVDMKATNTSDIAGIMTELLHPTSAVCGYPRKEALTFIHKHEKYDRELYSGFLGPVNIDNSIDLFVNLRCMQVFGNKVRLYAGAGITEDSVPAKEYEETESKLETMKQVLDL